MTEQMSYQQQLDKGMERMRATFARVVAAEASQEPIGEPVDDNIESMGHQEVAETAHTMGLQTVK